MAPIAKRTFSLTSEQSEFIDETVRSGKYASGSEVVRAGLRALQERDEAIQQWLRDEVAPSYDALMQGRAKTVSLDEAFDRIRAHHKRAINET